MRPKFMSQAMFMKFVAFRDSVLWMRTWYLRKFYGMNLHPTVRISFKARMDKTNPKGLSIGEKTMIAFDAIILAHDFSTRRHLVKTEIGARSFIGCGAIILPNIKVGDHCLVAAGAVVTRDVPDNCMVGGNPAKIIKEGIQTTDYGILVSDDVPMPDEANGAG